MSVLTVAASGAAVALLIARSGLRRDLDTAHAEASQLDQQLTHTTGERDALRDREAWLSAANDRMAADVETQRDRADELAHLLEAVTTGPGASPGLQPGDDPPPDLDAATAAGLWHLLLGHVTRRWAAVVGVPPENRHMIEGDTAGQLAQALAREAERLREEVGVDVEVTATPSAARPPHVGGPGSVAAPTPPVAVLVAAVELLGVLATSAQRVTVDVGDPLVVTGDGWLDPAGELAVVCDRAAAAGVVLEPVEMGHEQVRLVLHPRVRQPSSA